MRDGDAVPVSAIELANWARDNGVDLRVSGPKLPIVNARRAELHLPLFRLVVPATDRRAVPAAPVIAATENELQAAIQTVVGTRTGLMTPACAAWALKRTRSQRPPDKREVGRFSAIILNSQWRNTGEPIIFARDGKLNDGQIRLEAIVQTGIAVEVDVRFGVDPAAYETTNSGSPRNAADALFILGNHHSPTQAALARLLYLHDRGQLGVKGARKVEIPSVVNVIEETPAIPAIAEFMATAPFPPARTAPFGMVLVAAARLSSVEKALEFASLVAEGRDEDKTPTRSLHVRLRDIRMSASREKNPFEVAILAAKGWNAWATGKQLSLRVTSADLAAGGFPVIKAPSRL